MHAGCVRAGRVGGCVPRACVLQRVHALPVHVCVGGVCVGVYVCAHSGGVCEHCALRSVFQTCVLEYGCAHAAGVHRTFSL